MVAIFNEISDERARVVLQAVVEEHIAIGEPIGSKTLSRRRLPFSSALIRSIMARLEAAGYLHQPHTSAGRVPTVKGYRAYVDELLTWSPLSPDEGRRVAGDIEDDAVQDRPLAVAVSVLSRATGLAGFALRAEPDEQLLLHVELVRLRRCQILAILATSGGRVAHRLITRETDVSTSELERIQNYLNERCAGVKLGQLSGLVEAELQKQRQSDYYPSLAGRAFALLEQVLAGDPIEKLDVSVGGQHLLLSQPEFASGERARPVLERLERRDTWSQLADVLRQQEEAGELRVIIGPENGLEGLQDCTVVAAAVRWGEGAPGSVGLVGPMRLPYGLVLAITDWVRRRLNRRLDDTWRSA